MTVLGPQDQEFKIVSVSSGKVLQAQGSDDGAAVGQSWSSDHHDAHQRWRLLPVPGARHRCRIENVGTSMVLEVLEEALDAGARIVLRKDRGGAHKQWRLIQVTAGEHAIVNARSGKAIDLSHASHDDDAPIAQFEYWHGPQQRWRLITAEVSRTTRALITIVRNERVFLPLWLGYYRRFFRPEDIYVLDHRTTDGSTGGGGFVRIPVSQPTFGAAWQRDVVQRQQHELIDRYDAVLYAEVDEIVAPDPRWGDLGRYLDRLDQDFVTCQGYEVLHLKGEEPPFDPAKPVLTQRSTWYFNPLYSKSLLARVPMLWNGGFHERLDGATNSDPLLYLIHLHRMDYDICLARHRERSSFRRAQVDLDEDWGYQNRLTDPPRFAEWFSHDSCTGFPIQPQPIPAHWRSVV